MTAREELLDNVRRALKRQPGQPPQPLPVPRIQIPDIPYERRVDLFRTRLEELGGKVHRASSLSEAAAIVDSMIDGPAVASNTPLLRKAGITANPKIVSGITDVNTLRTTCAAAAYGITGADFGLAETGSLVMIASPEEQRLTSLLPDIHIALLTRDRLLTGLDQLYIRVPKPADRSSSMVFITGPSRSADIEMILVRGVHGPRAIHVIVVEEDFPS